MAVMMLVACSTLTPAEKDERRAKRAQAVEQALAARHYRVSVNMMYPRRGKAKTVSSDYGLEVKGETLVSYLPYFGRAYSVPYGGGKGLDFTALISEYKAEKDDKGTTKISILVNNEEDDFSYFLTVFDNGQSTIDVRAREREPISFSGDLTAADE